MTSKQLRDKRAALDKELGDLVAKENPTPEELTRAQELDKEIEALDGQIRIAEKHEERARQDSESAGTVAAQHEMPGRGVEVGRDLEAEKPFANLGEQLRAIYYAAVDRSRPVDKRLLRINEKRAILGMNEQIGSEGGFALQEDFAGSMFESAVSAGAVASRVSSYPVSSNANAAKWLELDETDVSTTVFGGVQVYWAAEGASSTATKPKLVERKLELEKLFGLAYASGELLEDTAFVTALYENAFRTAIARKLDIDILNGTGVGQPLGILNSDITVEVPKEAGQAAATVVYQNLVKMWTRFDTRYRGESIWWVHPDVEQQLMMMEFPVGTGGVPVFMPPGGASASPYSTLLGRPVVPTDACAALGTAGDIILAAPSEYMLITKGQTRSDVSIHVQFLTDQQAFRYIYRVNGKPKKSTALTIRNSSNTRSPFVTVAARA